MVENQAKETIKIPGPTEFYKYQVHDS